LHLVVGPKTSEILASKLATNEDGDALQDDTLLEQIPGPVASVIADGAFPCQRPHNLAEGYLLRHAVARGNRDVSLQSHHRQQPSRPDPVCPEDRNQGRLLGAEPDDRPLHASVATELLNYALDWHSASTIRITHQRRPPHLFRADRKVTPTSGMAGDVAGVDGRDCAGSAAGATSGPVRRGPPAHGEQMCRRSCPSPARRSGDADGDRASQVQHAVERMDGHVHLGRPAPVRA